MTIGGLSIAYVAIPTTKRIGSTIGGTRYFMVSLLKEIACDRPWPLSDAAALDHNKLDSTAAPRARQPNKIIA